MHIAEQAENLIPGHFKKGSYDFYRVLMILLLLLVIAAGGIAAFVLYQESHLPLPYFTAVATNGKSLMLKPHEEPNFLPNTIITWARKAGVAAYTFDFVNYNQQLDIAKQYFTPDGWTAYQASINNVISTVRQNQIFVNSVVTGPPVISNQGDYPGHGYVWRIQMPFLVTYQSSEATTKQKYMAVLSIVKIPTYINPKGIGIDQFVMR